MLNEPVVPALPLKVIPSGSAECIVTQVSVRPLPPVIASAIPCATKICAESLSVAAGSLYLGRMSVIDTQQQRKWGMSPTISFGAGSTAPENVIVSTTMGAHRSESFGPHAVTPGHVVLE